MLTFSKLSADQIRETAWDSQGITKLLPSPDCLTADNNNLMFAAWLDGQVIGLATLDSKLSTLPPTSGLLVDLFVLPQYRRQGVGRMLLGLVAGAVMEMGAYFLRGTQTHSEEAAAFAAKIGFAQDAAAAEFLLLDLTDTKGLRQH